MNPACASSSCTARSGWPTNVANARRRCCGCGRNSKRSRSAWPPASCVRRRKSARRPPGSSRTHGYRYYDWTLTKGTFQFVEHPVHLEQEKALEGTYLIQTEEPHLSPVEAVTVYKELSEVERRSRPWAGPGPRASWRARRAPSRLRR